MKIKGNPSTVLTESTARSSFRGSGTYVDYHPEFIPCGMICYKKFFQVFN